MMCLEDQIRQCAKDCGLTDCDVQKGMVGSLGDGVLLGKFLAFMQAVLPFILPLIVKSPAPPA